MQPYQLATESLKGQHELPGKLIKKGAGLAASAAFAYAGSRLLSRGLPLLESALPKDDIVKGLKKLNPKLGKFINQAEQYGYKFEDIKNFMKQKFLEAADEQGEEKSIFNEIVGKIDVTALSPEKSKKLSYFAMIADQLQAKGKTRNDPVFKKLEKKIKELLKGSRSILEEETERFDQAYPEEGVPEQGAAPGQGAPQGQPQEPQAGPGQQALMEILKKIQATRGQ